MSLFECRKSYITSISGGQSFAAGYNGDGHRLFKTQDGTTTRFVLDQATPLTQVLVENDDNNQAQNYYIHGHGLVQQIDASDNSSYFYHFDHVGSTTAMTDSSQNIIAGYNFSAYGRTKASTAHYNPFQYVGRWGIMDDNNGLHHMRARYYDQRTSRFLSQDSVLGVPTSPQTLGRYAYGLGNPYSNIDPSGRVPKNTDRLNQIENSLTEASNTFDIPIDFLASVLEIENSHPDYISTPKQSIADFGSFYIESITPESWTWKFFDQSYGLANMKYSKFSTSAMRLSVYYDEKYDNLDIYTNFRSDKLKTLEKKAMLNNDHKSIMAMAGVLRYEIGRVNYNLKHGYLSNIPTEFLNKQGYFPETGSALTLEQISYLATRYNAHGYPYWVNSYGEKVKNKVNNYRSNNTPLKFIK